MMALETLCKLPPVVEDTEEEDNMYAESGKLWKNDTDLSCIKTGTIGDEVNVEEAKENNSNSAADFDWGAPISNQLKNNSNLTNGIEAVSEEMDWSKPTVTFKDDLELELDLELERDEAEDEVPPDPVSIFSNFKTVPEVKVESEDGNTSGVEESSTGHKLDIMAQQYKFIACLKVSWFWDIILARLASFFLFLSLKYLFLLFPRAELNDDELWRHTNHYPSSIFIIECLLHKCYFIASGFFQC